MAVHITPVTVGGRAGPWSSAGLERWEEEESEFHGEKAEGCGFTMSFLPRYQQVIFHIVI